MTKHLFTILTLITLLTFAPAYISTASASIELSEIDNNQIKIEQQGTTLFVSGATGKNLFIYNIIGRIIASIKIENTETRIDLSKYASLNKTSLILIKVGNVSKRVNLPNR